MKKLLALWSLFRKGESVADPAAWKKGQITVTILTPFLLALAHVTNTFGLEVTVDENTATQISVGIIALVNVVLTVATTNKIGLAPPVVPPVVSPKDQFDNGN